MELAKESQHLTTLICSEGQFKYLRAPMGLISTGDNYNRHRDLSLTGIPNVQKVVDDILIHTDTFKDNVRYLIKVLERCQEHSITLSTEKFKFGEKEIGYVGYRISENGIEGSQTSSTSQVQRT